MKLPAGSQMDLCFSVVWMVYSFIPVPVFTVPCLYREALHESPICFADFSINPVLKQKHIQQQPQEHFSLIIIGGKDVK